MTLESHTLEYHMTDIIIYKILKYTETEKAGIEQLARADNRIFAVWFSKKVGSVMSVFNLKDNARKIFWCKVVL